jgi:hypothetical protein
MGRASSSGLNRLGPLAGLFRFSAECFRAAASLGRPGEEDGRHINPAGRGYSELRIARNRNLKHRGTIRSWADGPLMGLPEDDRPPRNSVIAVTAEVLPSPNNSPLYKSIVV